MTEPATDLWLGRDDVAWNILLVARLTNPPAAEVLRRRADDLVQHQGWPPMRQADLVEGDTATVLAALAETRDAGCPVSLGRTPEGVVLRGHHAYVDGLGLLAVLRALVAPDLSSGAAGVGQRGGRSTPLAIGSRLLEAALRPPAGVAGRPPHHDPPPGDVFATRTLAHTVRTAELARAAARAVTDRNRALNARAAHVAVAVGVSTVGGSELQVGDHSGYLRITGAERLDVPQIQDALRRAPLELGGTAGSRASTRAAGLIRWGSRVLADRMGSTLLVSHLGRVTAEGLEELRFYPFAATGSQVSLGASTLGQHTTITLRSRAARHATIDLEELLDAIAASLTRAS